MLVPALKMTAVSERRIDKAIRGTETVNTRIVTQGPAVMAVLTDRLEHAVSDEFKAGTDKHGESHDKTGATLGTLKKHTGGLEGYVEMEGAASLVEFGSKAHKIKAHDDGYLHFKGEDGWARVKEVDHPGYKGDDFAGRALDDVHAEEVLTAFFSDALMSAFEEEI
jgi:hypothetical protein